MSAEGFTVIAVALDESADDVREFAEGISFPVLLDRDHLLAELYAVSNVPTVIWIDADGTVARPNAAEVGTDMFVDFTGVRPDEHMDQIRAWVREGTVPDDASFDVADLDPAEVDARLAFRLGVHFVAGRRRPGHALVRSSRRAGPDGLHRPSPRCRCRMSTRSARPSSSSTPNGRLPTAMPFHGVPRNR
ncbi:MAG: TlpA disulfide reductase family protein [Acidimicrobiales bacterium]